MVSAKPGHMAPGRSSPRSDPCEQGGYPRRQVEIRRHTARLAVAQHVEQQPHGAERDAEGDIAERSQQAGRPDRVRCLERPGEGPGGGRSGCELHGVGADERRVAAEAGMVERARGQRCDGNQRPGDAGGMRPRSKAPMPATSATPAAHRARSPPIAAPGSAPPARGRRPARWRSGAARPSAPWWRFGFRSWQDKRRPGSRH